MGTITILVAGVLSLLSFSPVSAQTEKRVALVIGNAAYPENPLKNPVNDARAMASVLKQTGFQVIVRENATKQDMERAVGEFGRALQPGAVALFYYAGHGVQVNGRNFLIPVDASVESEHSVRLETLDVDLVLDQIASRGSDVNVVILDACRNNPFERRFRSRGGGLAQIDAPKGTLIAHATAPGRTALDGAGENGVYTARLIEAMKTPGLPVEEVFKRVRAEVSRETADAQTPWEASSLVGQFYFDAPATVVVNPGTDRDAIHWQSVKDASDAALVQTYLDKYPEGAFAVLARARIEELQRPSLLAAFDGAWAGTYKCGALQGSNLAGWTEANRLFAIKSGRIAGVARWKQKEDGATGRVAYTGSVDAAGTVTIVGIGAYDAGGRTYRVFLRGGIAEGRLTAEGSDGSRDCSLDYRRLPAANEAAMRRPAGVAGSFDGIWQGMHRCSATSDGKHGAIANSGKQLTVKDGRIEEDVRWRVPETGAMGTDSLAGLVSDDGGFVLVGKGLYDSGASYRLYYYGSIAGGLLTAGGKNGSRDCTMDLVRVTASGAGSRPKP